MPLSNPPAVQSAASPGDQPRHDPEPDPPVDLDVLIVGAGPTGLTAAIDAVRHGLSVRIVDRAQTRSTFSKALVAHARTLEIFQTMGVADAVVAEGTRFAALHIHGRRRKKRVDLLGLPWGDTAYPFWLSIPQHSTERILEERLHGLGVDVEWAVSFEKATEYADHVEAHVLDRDGAPSVVRARWLVGCDGGRSRVRDQAGLRLDRAVSGATFVLADVKTTASLAEDEGHVFVVPEGLLFIVPMPEPRRWRIIAHELLPSSDPPATIDTTYVNDLVRRRTGWEFGSHDLTWQSRFELSHGVADSYRRGRMFLAGDAAHVHSPVGGQGLNTGVQDAHNLLWKLASARHLSEDDATELLDTYVAERSAVGKAMVDGVARMTRLITTRKGLTRRLFGAAGPMISGRPSIQKRLGRGVGMLELGYVQDTSRSRMDGRRMPNPTLRGGQRLHERLDPVSHTWVTRRNADDGMMNIDDSRWGGLPVVFVSDDDIAVADRDSLGGMPEAVLVRPDGYIAADDHVRFAPTTTRSR